MKTALVTGAYKELGLEWCRYLAAQGYHAILTAREIWRTTDAVVRIDVPYATRP